MYADGTALTVAAERDGKTVIKLFPFLRTVDKIIYR